MTEKSATPPVTSDAEDDHLHGVARSADKSRIRAMLFGVGVLALALIIAAVKHALGTISPPPRHPVEV